MFLLLKTDAEWGTTLPVSLSLLFLALVKVNSETVTPYLSFRSKNLPNHSYVDVFSISLTDHLRCRSELQNCCSRTQGNWVFPNGTSLGYSYSNGVYQYNTTQRVELIRVSWITTTPNGIYRCEIAVDSDEPLVTQSLYVGLYTNDGGEIMISRHITLTVNSDLNGASPHFTLTCISTGGPATTVTWTRDSTTVTEGNITVLHNTTTAQYTHTLTVTGRMPGLYNCTVKNNKPSTKSRTFTVQVASAPTNLASIVAGNDSTSIHLTWTPPTPLRDTTGYRISFTGGGNSSSVDVSGSSTDNYTLTGLTRGEMYNISILGVSEHFYSQSVAWDTVKPPGIEDGATASGDERGGEEGKEGAGQKQNYSSGLVAGIVAPFIFLAIVAASGLVGWKYLCHRRCIKGLFGSTPSATTSTTSNTVNSASPSTPIYDEVDTLRGVTSSHDIQLTSNEAYAPVIKTSANSAYGQYY